MRVNTRDVERGRKLLYGEMTWRWDEGLTPALVRGLEELAAECPETHVPRWLTMLPKAPHHGSHRIQFALTCVPAAEGQRRGILGNR